jgi:hypothetical protein
MEMVCRSYGDGVETGSGLVPADDSLSFTNAGGRCSR